MVADSLAGVPTSRPFRSRTLPKQMFECRLAWSDSDTPVQVPPFSAFGMSAVKLLRGSIWPIHCTEGYIKLAVKHAPRVVHPRSEALSASIDGLTGEQAVTSLLEAMYDCEHPETRHSLALMVAWCEMYPEAVWRVS